MTYSYDEKYLKYVQNNLGIYFQFALTKLKFSPKKVQDDFLNSMIPVQIQNANPNFLCGKTGYEFILLVYKDFKNIDKLIIQAQNEVFYPEKEYWSGYILAYSQWKNNITFNRIFSKLNLQDILNYYNPYHEADISKIDSVICRYI